MSGRAYPTTTPDGSITAVAAYARFAPTPT